jgi:dGTPase
LAPFATRQSRGRLFNEPLSASRTEFQRDRDRVIHSGAFRKLRNKTQVFIENEGDYYRTRLTHSLEVAQISRSAARALGLNEDLTEAIALAHDLGHTCFGHTGEDALDEMMKPYGGFDHNDQTFRILTQLEEHYAQFDGLNLTWETLEGVAKHNGPLLPLKQGEKLTETIAAFDAKWSLELDRFAGPEAQLAAIGDDIAYNTHDVDDGYRAGLISAKDLSELPIFGKVLFEVQKRYPAITEARAVREAVREVIGLMVTDMMTTTKANLAALAPQSVEDIYAAKSPVAGLSETLVADIAIIREFLLNRMYRYGAINRVRAKAERIVRQIFGYLMENPNCLPDSWYAQTQGADERRRARIVADYIAGMTDPFAVQEHRQLFSTETMI